MSEVRTGAAAPNSVTVIGGSDGTRARALRTGADGSLVSDPAGGRTILYAAISAASSGNNTIVAAVTGKKITVLGYTLVADGTVTATWQDGAGGTALSGAMAFVANSGVSSYGGGIPIMQGLTNNTLLNLSLSAGVGVRGHIAYYTV